MTDIADILDPLAIYAIEQVAEGRTLKDIGEELQLSLGAVYSRCTASPELQRRYLLARETATDVLESELMEVARTSDDSKMARVHVNALQWVIEKRNPHRYGNQMKLAHTSPDGSMTPKATAPIAIDAALVQALVDKLTG